VANVGRPIVTNGGGCGVTVRKCMNRLRSGVVRGIGRGIGVLDGGPHRARGEGEICRGCSRFLLLNFLLGRRWRNDFGLFVKI